MGDLAQSTYGGEMKMTMKTDTIWDKLCRKVWTPCKHMSGDECAEKSCDGKQYPLLKSCLCALLGHGLTEVCGSCQHTGLVLVPYNMARVMEAMSQAGHFIRLDMARYKDKWSRWNIYPWIGNYFDPTNADANDDAFLEACNLAVKAGRRD